MSLKFFADHCIPNSVIVKIREAGHEVLRLRDHIPTDSIDHEVISNAQDLKCILISLNGDFADIVSYPPADYKGIIALHVGNHPEIISQLLTMLMDYLAEHAEMNHYHGKLLLVEAHRIRVRE